MKKKVDIYSKEFNKRIRFGTFWGQVWTLKMN